MSNKLKRILKKIAPPLINLVTKIELPFVHEKCDLDPKKSYERINSIWPDHPVIIKRENTISPKKNLTIIIPVYNAEKYLRECLDSVLNQKTKYSYSVIAVDDGGKDGSLNILKEYEGKITIIEEENGGAAKARNQGLKAIESEYLMFVDADDILLPEAIETLLDIAYKENADIVQGGNQIFEERCLIKETEEKIIDAKGDFTLLNGFPWGKVIKSEIFKDAIFPEGYDYEDSLMAYWINPSSKKTLITSKKIYGYRVGGVSATTRVAAKPKCLETIYISLALWSLHMERFGTSLPFNKNVLSQISLNHRRIARLEKAHKGVQKDAFAITKEKYLSMFPEQSKGLKGKRKSLDKAIRNNNYAQYRLICERWEHIH